MCGRRYGVDCSRRAAGLPLDEPPSEPTQPWVAALGLGGLPPAAQRMLEEPGQGQAQGQAQGQGLSQGQRRKPLIYVYDVPSTYATRMLQYRFEW